MGAPAKPIRLMVSLLIIKSLRNLSDENLIEQWVGNIFFLYCGVNTYNIAIIIVFGRLVDANTFL